MLLADEPTGNLDPKTADHVFGTLAALVKASGLAALVATHNLDLAARMDRRVTIRDGQVRRWGEPPLGRSSPAPQEAALSAWSPGEFSSARAPALAGARAHATIRGRSLRGPGGGSEAMAVQLFLSCVSDEFGAYRDELAPKALTRPNVEVKIQEDFKALGGDTLSMLEVYIKRSAKRSSISWAT